MNLGLEGKTVMITGGASGLGAAMGEAFRQEGANLVVFDLGAPAGERSGCLYVRGDVTQGTDIERALREGHQRFGGVDILVNNAGIWPSSLIAEMADEEWERVLRVNLTGVYLCSKRFLVYLGQNGRKGRIVNIASPVAFQGSGNGHSHYAAAKAGVVSFTQSLALEVAKKGHRVVAVAPGIMYTEMTRSTLDAATEKYLQRIPIGRFVTPEEVAGVVVFAASERAGCITGATIDATGGMLMR